MFFSHAGLRGHHITEGVGGILENSMRAGAKNQHLLNACPAQQASRRRLSRGHGATVTDNRQLSEGRLQARLGRAWCP